MKTITKLITALFVTLALTSLVSARLKPETGAMPVPSAEPCSTEGECEVVYDAHLDAVSLQDGVLANKMFVNPTFSGKLTAVALKNVVFLNGKLGAIDLSGGAVLDRVVFRGNQISSLNFGGAKLSGVVLEGNLKHPPQYGVTEEQLAEPTPLNLNDAIVQNSIFVNNVVLIRANKNTVIHKTIFTRNNMIGSSMQGAKIADSDFSGNDARDSDLRFGSATGVKIVKNQAHGAKYPKARKGQIAIHGNWVNNPVNEWERLRTKKVI